MSKDPSLNPNSNYDVAVIGGGPGGTALATFLARAGHRCVIFEQGKFPRYHIGESLIPHTYGIFERLGLLPQLRASNFPVKHSVRFVSHSGKESVPFYFSETIPGDRARTWQVERSQFDCMVLDHAPCQWRGGSRADRHRQSPVRGQAGRRRADRSQGRRAKRSALQGCCRCLGPRV